MITYKTTFDTYTDYKNSNRTAENQAWLGGKWTDPQGTPPATPYNVVMPTIAKDATEASVVLKKAGTYNPTDHTIEWTVVVNTNKSDLGNQVYLKDFLSGAQGTISSMQQKVIDQEYVDYVPYSVTAGYTVERDTKSVLVDTSNTPVFRIYPENNKSGNVTGEVSFKIKTRLLDKDAAGVDLKPYYANNNPSTEVTARKFYNTAYLSTSVGPTDIVTADVTPTSDMIKKTVSTYDQKTKTMTWTVTVNSNKMAMDNLYLTDEIAPGLILNTANITVNSRVADPGTGQASDPCYAYTGSASSGGTLTVYLGNTAANGADAKKVIVYSTQVDTDYAGFGMGISNNNQTAVTIQNQAVVHRDNFDDVSVITPITIPNEELQKTSTYPAEGNDISRIQYRVQINKNQAAIPNGTVISDTISSSLQFDLSSIKLYEASVSNTGLTDDTLVSPKSISTVGNADGTTTLQITLPDNSGNKAYILIYKACVVDLSDGATYGNTVRFGMVTASPTAVYTWTRSELFSSGGSVNGIKGKQAYAQFKKVDENGDPLSGATFALYLNGAQVSTAVSKADGTVDFIINPATSGYTIKEIAAPSGYAILNDTITVPRTNATATATLADVMNKKQPITPVQAAPPSDPGTPSKPYDPYENIVWENEKPKPTTYSPEALKAWQEAYDEWLKGVLGEKLPKTGGFVGSALLFMLGASMVGGGVYLNKKGKKYDDDEKTRRD